MSRRTFINILESIFPPDISEAMKKDLLGAKVKLTTLDAETTLILDFTEYKFHEVLLGSADITALDAGVAGLEVGEQVYLKIVQDSTAARTITWGVGILTDVTISNTTDDIDLLVGVFDGNYIIFGALAQNVV